MKKLKRILPLLLALAIIISLNGCIWDVKVKASGKSGTFTVKTDKNKLGTSGTITLKGEICTGTGWITAKNDRYTYKIEDNTITLTPKLGSYKEILIGTYNAANNTFTLLNTDNCS